MGTVANITGMDTAVYDGTDDSFQKFLSLMDPAAAERCENTKIGLRVDETYIAVGSTIAIREQKICAVYRRTETMLDF